MNQWLRRILLLSGFVAIAAVAFLGARYWQSVQAQYTRIAPLAGCDLRTGPCRVALAGGSLTFAIVPQDIPLMQPLRLIVSTEGLGVRRAVVEVRGRDMNMGLNRSVLEPTADGRWEGETILPVCSQTRMEWEAAVRLDAGERYEVPFVFDTTRP